MKSYFDCIMNIGEDMLICGAEVHRVEDSIMRMCSSVGFLRTDVFIITSSMVVTIHTNEGTYTETRRVTRSGMDIEKIHRLNALSRKICENKLSVAEIEAEYNDINNVKKYPFWAECLSFAFIAGAFAIFFGGSIIEGIIAMITGACLSVIDYVMTKSELNKIFIKLIGSLFVSFAAFLAVKLGAIQLIDNVVIGNIMLLIPGVGLTNSLRDLLAGDSIAGLLRMIEAILAALAIAAGYFLFVSLTGGATL